MTMEQFLENISYDTINFLKKKALKTKGAGGDEEEMDEPEMLKLMMMHMSKNHHEDELTQFGLVGEINTFDFPATEFTEQKIHDEDKQQRKQSTSFRRKRSARTKTT